jgi:pimeloyl-ACP methyl ester carboxylesterase
MVSEREIELADGRLLHVHDSDDGGVLTVLWHHGSPQTGALLEPVLGAARARGVRLVSYGRPSYGGSSPHPGRDVASAAADVAQVLDHLGLDRVAVMGASGGGPHALACAALLAGRVRAVVTLAGLAPFDGSEDWYAGMASDGALRAARQGRAERARYAETEEFDEASFNAGDWAALDGAWAALGADVGRAAADGQDGLIDDDVAFVRPWGFDPGQVQVPVLLVHGGDDRVVPFAHARSLLRGCPQAELWVRPRDGHIGVLHAVPVALDWLLALR